MLISADFSSPSCLTAHALTCERVHVCGSVGVRVSVRVRCAAARTLSERSFQPISHFYASARGFPVIPSQLTELIRCCCVTDTAGLAL